MARLVLSFPDYNAREASMRYAILGLAVAAGLAASFLAGPASAEPYRWCANYGGKAGGTTNCGFVTLAQCRATVSGMGGFCAENQFYSGPGRTVRYKRNRHID
jgi:hypothetical protein